MKSNANRVSKISKDYSKTLLVVGVFVHIVFLLSLIFGFLNPLFDDSTHRLGQGADFYAVYQAAQNVIDGVSVYDRHLIIRAVPYCYPYRYLPFTALTLGQFFHLFKPEVAYAIWILILEILLFLNINLTSKIFTSANHKRIAISLWLLFSPYYLELYMGQFSFFMATLFFWIIHYWSEKKNVAGDAIWIISLLIKTNSVLFVPVLMKMKKWKSMLSAVLLVALVSLPYFLMMPGSFKSFAWNYTEGLSVETLAGNQGFASLLSIGVLRLFDQWYLPINLFFQNISAMNAIVRPILLLWSILTYSFSLWLTFRTSKQYAMELFCFWIMTYFLTYKHVWEHHYVMLLPVFVFLFLRIIQQNEVVLIPKIIFWVTFVLIALPTPFIFIDKSQVLIDPEFYWTSFESLLFHFAKPLAVLVLYTYLFHSLWKYGRASIEPQEVIIH